MTNPFKLNINHNLTVLRKAVKRRSFAILGVLNTHYKNENSRPDTTEREHSFKGICSETPIATSLSETLTLFSKVQRSYNTKLFFRCQALI